MMDTLAPWLSTLAVASLKGSVILIAVLLIARGMRRSSAEARHAILAIGLVAFMIVPAATMLMPAWGLIRVPALAPELAAAITRASGDGRITGDARAMGERRTDARASGEAADASSSRQGTDGNVASRVGRRSSAAAGAVAPPRVAGLDGAHPGSETLGTVPGSILATDGGLSPADLPSRGGELVFVWILGASLIALRLMVGLVRLRVLSTRATMVTDGAWLQTAHGIARRLGLTRGVTLLRGDRDSVPMTWGVLSPVVWLPPAADRWPTPLRASVLSHELAHVRRRDAVMQWVANVALALHWFNPLVWLATRALRAERERACDDAVLALGAAPDDYAAHLLDMVRALGTRSGPAPAMAMARRSQFEGRLLAILDRACSRGPVGGGRLVAAGAGAATLVLALGALRTTEAARTPDSMVANVQPPVVVNAPAPRRGVDAGTPDRTAARQRSSVQTDAPIAPRGPDRPVGPSAPAAPSMRTVVSDETRIAPESSPDRDRDASAAPEASVEATLEHVGAGAIATPPVAPAPMSPPSLSPPPSARELSRGLRAQGAALSRNDTALLLDVIAAAEGISSSSDRVAVLERVASLPDLAPSVVTALGRAAGRVTSSTSRTKLLRAIVRKQPHAVGESRRAVLDAMSHEVTSSDVGAILEEFVKRDSITDAALADAFTTAARISSSTEKGRFLVAAARHRKPEGAARAAYLKTAATITTGSDRAAALSALFEDPPGPPRDAHHQ